MAASLLPSSLSSFLADLKKVRPPGPFFQKINAILHQEPLATLLYGLYWSLLISLCSPFAVWALLGRTLLKLVALLKERSEATNWTTIASAHVYDPQKMKTTNSNDDDDTPELAILVTGCDSGFGKEIVIWAAQAGYVVFAGCLQAASFAQFRDLPNVVPFHMDVTKAHHVETAVTKVQEWLKQEAVTTTTKTNRKDRILHALINNAGIGYAADIDWMTMEDIQKTMDGKLHSKSA
jgi:short chain dehydrogenase